MMSFKCLSYLKPINFKLNNKTILNKTFYRRKHNSVNGNKLSNVEGKLVRNIGIMAHVDAGKTTTTERMLYYSGFIRIMGEIDDGDTIMDYMDQERSRGITINSAAITFNWKNHKINLVDTPGHVDFTMEVERAVCALDGAITILDASAGVEPQTLTVWKQANRYEVPRIIYLNKMDKPKANLEMCIKSIVEKLKIQPLVLHLPTYNDGKFSGVIDLINMKKYKWDQSNQGKTYISSPLPENDVKTRSVEARRKLIETAVDMDSELADLVLSHDDWENVDPLTLQKAIRRITLSNSTAVPVFCGSSYKNIGVQLLMDSIVDYLPSPLDVKCKNVQYYDGQFCALVFKILYDSKRDFVSILRIYNGELVQGQKLYNVNQKMTERIGKIFAVYADEYEQIEKATAGNIVAVTGLKSTITGDTVVSSSSVANAAMKRYSEECKNTNNFEVAPLLGGLQVPDPVFFCSVEPLSLSQQKPLEFALQCLKREDPSLSVNTDPETGQTVLSGMGELHLDIIKDRIQNQYKVKAEMGPLQVSYRETVKSSVDETITLSQNIGGTKSHVVVTLGIKPSENKHPMVKLEQTRDNQENLSQIRKPHMAAVENGIKLALLNGPILGFPVENVEIGIRWLQVESHSSLPSIAAAASKCINVVLRKANPILLEPVMRLEVIAEKSHLHSVLGDLNRRRAHILHIGDQQNLKTLHALVPLAELVGYSTSLRIITSGLATFTMILDSYQTMSANDQQKIVQKLTGFT